MATATVEETVSEAIKAISHIIYIKVSLRFMIEAAAYNMVEFS